MIEGIPNPAWIVRNLWLIPVLPLLAAGLAAIAPQRRRRLSASLAIGAMSCSLVLAGAALAEALHEPARQVVNFPWLQFGGEWLRLGWILDPLTAVMLVMVTFVSLLIFIYSVGYMDHDANFTRFFCFLSLFGAAMLGVVVSNSLLLLFMCWEVVGLTSYLLIGFWYQKPEAAAAAAKAFITTRIGDLGFFLGMLWLYGQTGTLLFYDHGAGCLEHSALTMLAGRAAALGMAASTGIALLIFCGAVGKSGQLPLHVWLPDAMEGPTPVSALIHAATMVAAGVFLIARVYPLMAAPAAGVQALTVVAWVGAITAFFAATIAVAQNDIKRILAYSTVSQLGYMMLGLGVGGVAVGFFHLITHAFFKALLFLGAGSVIHGCTEEQDIRNMGGLRKLMPITFATYAVGTLALCGVPLFSGFWSKDEILHAAHGWSVSQVPYALGAAGALLTAFYMTRQVCYVFFGNRRQPAVVHPVLAEHAADHGMGLQDTEFCDPASGTHAAHESPAVMTAPLIILAFFAALLGFLGTPAWPWFQAFLEGRHAAVDFGQFSGNGILMLMAISTAIVCAGLAIGWWFYGRRPIENATAPDPTAPMDPLERLQPRLFHALANRLYVDEFYGMTVIRLARAAAQFCDWLDRWVWNGAVQAVRWLVLGAAHMDASFDSYVVNAGFDEGCRGVRQSGGMLSRIENGRVQSYLRILGAALVVLALFLVWGRRG
ncbi:MAG TPA: NADH-quinone oxidoreductase subunit L [Acidobacteriaceae bacterium]|jgi:NADH-quinone oxidoreductase subunit L|nr:NADH-quinone oxidoreductase subunit L [Acidobacteriaceae bacterium]